VRLVQYGQQQQQTGANVTHCAALFVTICDVPWYAMPCRAASLQVNNTPSCWWLVARDQLCGAVLCRVVSCSFSAAKNDLNSLLLAGCMDGSVHLLHAGDNQGVFRSCVDSWKQ
jgi:hypothetical protein